MISENFYQLSVNELSLVNGGGGKISNAINACVGTVLSANFIAAGAFVAVAATPVVGVAAGAAVLAAGVYCIKNAID